MGERGGDSEWDSASRTMSGGSRGDFGGGLEERLDHGVWGCMRVRTKVVRRRVGVCGGISAERRKTGMRPLSERGERDELDRNVHTKREKRKAANAYKHHTGLSRTFFPSHSVRDTSIVSSSPTWSCSVQNIRAETSRILACREVTTNKPLPSALDHFAYSNL